jgi:hypothetical protein
MIATAFTALLCWATSNRPLYVSVSTAVGGAFALGAMHHPWLFLGLTISLLTLLPDVCGSSANDYLAGCSVLGWLWGAIGGVIVRRSRGSAGRHPERHEPVAPE